MRRTVTAGAIAIMLSGSAALAQPSAGSLESVIAPPRGSIRDATPPAPVPDPNKWTEIGVTGADSVWLIKLADVARKADRFPQVWIRIDRSEEKRQTISETHVLYAISCDGHGIQYLKWIDYNSDGSIANQEEAKFDPNGYQPVRQATMSQAVEDSACGRRAWWYDPKIPLAEVEPFN